MLNIESNFLSLTVIAYLASMIFYFTFASFKKDALGRTACYLLILGLVLHAVSLGARIALSGRLPFANLYESLTSLSFGMVLIYLIIERAYNVRIVGAAAVPVAFLAVLYASTLNKEIDPLMPALQSNWLLAHVGVAIAAYGAFAISFGAAILYLLTKQEKFDELAYKLIAFAFPFMTLVLITGAVWAEQAWGRYWSWDPKETWSLITWLVYLGYLHARLVLRWKGKAAAWLAIIGFLAVLFTYLGVSFLLSGLHSYT